MLCVLTSFDERNSIPLATCKLYDRRSTVARDVFSSGSLSSSLLLPLFMLLAPSQSLKLYFRNQFPFVFSDKVFLCWYLDGNRFFFCAMSSSETIVSDTLTHEVVLSLLLPFAHV